MVVKQMESNDNTGVDDAMNAKPTRPAYQEKIITILKTWWIYIVIGLIAGFLLGYVNGLVSSIVT